MKQGTQSWCSGTTQMDRMGRKVEGGSGWGDTRAPMAEFMSMYGKNHHNVKTNLPLKLINKKNSPARQAVDDRRQYKSIK